MKSVLLKCKFNVKETFFDKDKVTKRKKIKLVYCQNFINLNVQEDLSLVLSTTIQAEYLNSLIIT